jgi:hypothetical protein
MGRVHRGAQPRPREAALPLRLRPRVEVIGAHAGLEPRRLRASA